jgi:hypothetical protein
LVSAVRRINFTFQFLPDGNAEIYAINADGSGVRLTNNTAYDSFSQALYIGAAAALSGRKIARHDSSPMGVGGTVFASLEATFCERM